MRSRFIINLSVLLLLPVVVFSQQLSSADYNQHRNSLKNSFTKFQTEKKGRVAFLGGSITHNPGWRDSVCNYLEETFPETEFDFVAAGIPSTGSTPGAFRFEKDILKNGTVDLLFEEAAVNDATNGRSPSEMIRGMEGIVRHAKLDNPKCDVVIMHFVDPDKMEKYRSGEIPKVIQMHEKVAEHYNVSTINLAKEVTERIDAGEFTWEDDFINLHPSPFGQGVYARSMIQFLESEFKSFSDAKTEDSKLPGPLDKYSYYKGKMVEPNPPKPIKGWDMVDNWSPDNGARTREGFVDVPMLVGKYPGKIIKFQFKGTAVGIAVAAGPDAGIIEYSVDDQPWEELDLFTKWSKNLYLPWFYTLESELRSGRHTLQIRLTDKKNTEGSGYKCMIKYFYFNQE